MFKLRQYCGISLGMSQLETREMTPWSSLGPAGRVVLAHSSFGCKPPRLQHLSPKRTVFGVTCPTNKLKHERLYFWRCRNVEQELPKCSRLSWNHRTSNPDGSLEKTSKPRNKQTLKIGEHQHEDHTNQHANLFSVESLRPWRRNWVHRAWRGHARPLPGARYIYFSIFTLEWSSKYKMCGCKDLYLIVYLPIYLKNVYTLYIYVCIYTYLHMWLYCVYIYI